MLPIGLYWKAFECFKPYYKWNTFNTILISVCRIMYDVVLNLIINGIPSIPDNKLLSDFYFKGFKPYYKWNTFNTTWMAQMEKEIKVLNLIINGIPSILCLCIPSFSRRISSFKPYYKWNTFNT